MSNTDRPLQYIKGVGPRRAEALDQIGLKTTVDVLNYIPYGYVDRNAASSIAELFDKLHSPDLWSGSAQSIASVSGETTLIASVIHTESKTIGKSRRIFTAVVADDSGTTAQLVYWTYIPYFEKSIRVGDTYIISGVPDYEPRWNSITFTHPELEKIEKDDVERVHSGAILPKYKLPQKLKSAGISMRLMRTIVEHAMDDALRTVVDTFPMSFIQRLGLMPLQEALKTIHFPDTHGHVEQARFRLTFEEIFYFELLLATRQRSRKSVGRGLQMDVKSPLARAVMENVSFELTHAQKRVIREIMNDMSSGKPMNRLLQGDVGSGKTIVALLCMLNAIDNGYQTIIMAPTEILADQHYRNISKLVEGIGVSVELVVGGQKKKQRAEILSRIAAGETHIVVGTHALIESEVQYHKLGLAVIDEQHRFGVAQRAELKRMGNNPHFLVMSATPIPRTLSMTLYGDLDVSIIDELPSNRKPIATKIVFESGLERTYDFIKKEIAAGRQAYVVYPLVEKSEKLALKSAVEHFELLQQGVFKGYNVGLLHGQMFWYEKDEAMQKFLAKEIDVMVATTVVEVGVDVPNATVMLIQDAERFGLAQLHQLRGRVGRSVHQSYCFLATKDHFRFAVAKAHAAEERAKGAVRLKTMEETTDGFKIAEVDLRLRGPGDLMGTRQSGLPEFLHTDLIRDAPIISQARNEAFGMIDADPQLRKEEHGLIRERLIKEFEAKAFITVA